MKKGYLCLPRLVFCLCIGFSCLFSACSKENSAQKQDALTASAPATGEASTLNERNANNV
jgi:thiol:disulfide interchange protein DsbC